MTASRRSTIRGQLLRLLAEANGDDVTIDVLADKLASNSGAVTKALSAMAGFCVIHDAKAARFAPAGVTQPFQECDESVRVNILNYWVSKNAVATFGAELLASELRGSRSLAIDSGTTVAIFFRHLMAQVNTLPPNRPHLAVTSLNPMAVADILRVPHHNDTFEIVGGQLDFQRCSVLGESAVQQLKARRFNWAVLGVARASVTGTLGQPTPEMIEQKQALIESADRVLFMLSEEKIVFEKDTSCCPLFKADSTLEHIAKLKSPSAVTLVVATNETMLNHPALKLLEYASSLGVTAHLLDSSGQEINAPRRLPGSEH